MVAVPRLTTPETRSIPDRSQPSTVDTGALTTGLTAPGKQLSALGAAAQKSGDKVFETGIEIAKRENIRESLEREAAMSDKLRAALYDPNSGLLVQKGKNAIGITKTGTEMFRKLDGDAQKTIPNGHQREIWARLMRSRRDTTLSALARHEASETRRAQIEGLNSALAQSVISARQSAAHAAKYPVAASLKVKYTPTRATTPGLQYVRVKAYDMPEKQEDMVPGRVYRGADGKFYEAFEDSSTGKLGVRKTEDPTAKASKNLLYDPTGGSRITSKFGVRAVHPVTGKRGVPHYGTDFGLPQGASVYAAHDGTVVMHKGFIGIRGADGTFTRYVHTRAKLVPGTKVKAGDVIAVVGPKDRMSTGAHLHFEVYKNGKAVDPQSMYYADRKGRVADHQVAAGRDDKRVDGDKTIQVKSTSTPMVQESLKRGEDMIRQRAALQGLSKAGTDLAIRRYRQTVYGSIAQDLAAINPAQARQFMWQHKDYFDPLKFKQVDHKLQEAAFKVELTQDANGLFKRYPDSESEARNAIGRREDLTPQGKSYLLNEVKKLYKAQAEAKKVSSKDELARAMKAVRTSDDPLTKQTPWLAVDEDKLTEADKKKWQSFLKERTPETNLKEYEQVQRMSDKEFKEWADGHTVRGQEPLSMLNPQYLNWSQNHVKALQERYQRITQSGSSETPLTKFAGDYLLSRGYKLDEEAKTQLRYRLSEMERNLKDQGRSLTRDQMIQITRDTWKSMGNSDSKFKPDDDRDAIYRRDQIPELQFGALNARKNPYTGKKYSEESHRIAWTRFKQKAPGWSPSEIDRTPAGRKWRQEMEIAAMRKGRALSDLDWWNAWRLRNSLSTVDFYAGLENTPQGPGVVTRMGANMDETSRRLQESQQGVFDWIKRQFD